MSKSIVEITVRRFFTSDEADMVPKVVVRGPLEGNWQDGIVELVKRIDEEARGAPLTNIREMTAAEIEHYIRSEEHEEMNIPPCDR